MGDKDHIMRIGLMLSMPGDLTGTKGLIERAQRYNLMISYPDGR